MRRIASASRASFPLNALSSKKLRALQRCLRLEALEGRSMMAADLTVTDSYDPSQILVQLNDDSVAAHIAAAGGMQIGQSEWWTVPTQSDVSGTIAAYQHRTGVATAIPDYTLELSHHVAVGPNDVMFQAHCLWGLDNYTGAGGDICGFTSGTNGADVDALGAWGAMSTTEDVVVAVIDSGVDYNHPDLASNIWINAGEIPGDKKDNDGNGYIDDYRGWDFVPRRGDNNPMDENGHGTHVAGTIAAVGNNNSSTVGSGMVGLAYNNVKIMALRVFDAYGRGSSSSVIAAIDYAVKNGAKISNNSYTMTGLSAAVASATSKGHLFIAAAGNNGSSAPQSPASYAPAVDNVISVAASTRFDTYASFSNHGPTVDLAAPGEAIWSTFPISKDTGDGAKDGYRQMSGTSMATPHVVGTAALVWAQNPALSAAEVKSIVLGSVETPATLTGKTTVTNGRLNAANAVLAASTTPPISASSNSATTANDPAVEGNSTLQGFIASLNGDSFDFSSSIAAQAYPVDRLGTIRLEVVQISEHSQVGISQQAAVKSRPTTGFSSASAANSSLRVGQAKRLPPVDSVPTCTDVDALFADWNESSENA